MPLVIAHRGASAYAPENTLAAFRLAMEAEADGIEMDARLAKDGVVVVFHDPTLKRVAGNWAKLDSYTSAELKEIDVGSWFGSTTAAFANETVPTLAETLEYIEAFRGPIYIELKCRAADAERLSTAVSSVIRESHLFPQIIVKSFKLNVISFIKAACPEVRTAALFAPKIRNIMRRDKHLLNLAKELGVDELSLHHTLATKKLLKKAARRGLRVAVWTVDNPRWIKKALKLGVHAVITNDPDRMLARRRELEAEPA